MCESLDAVTAFRQLQMKKDFVLHLSWFSKASVPKQDSLLLDKGTLHAAGTPMLSELARKQCVTSPMIYRP